MLVNDIKEVLLIATRQCEKPITC